MRSDSCVCLLPKSNRKKKTQIENSTKTEPDPQEERATSHEPYLLADVYRECALVHIVAHRMTIHTRRASHHHRRRRQHASTSRCRKQKIITKLIVALNGVCACV